MVAKDERKGPARAPAPRRNRTSGEGAGGGNVGSALRSVYDETVSENIPGEMLDLLNKLS
ncbi:NepR family anti-sigma factor [Sphingomonas profundi]|uniref:NepR family anti-sigma factor n=1 Tax=Alterirhizorhabdus profundi TaxID=2681549 RepID=UPI0012E7AD0C|nr:NepR family anti-sigma factor [Sphingomonas profundi]